MPLEPPVTRAVMPPRLHLEFSPELPSFFAIPRYQPATILFFKEDHTSYRELTKTSCELCVVEIIDANQSKVNEYFCFLYRYEIEIKYKFLSNTKLT